jgi:hypothetical protein
MSFLNGNNFLDRQSAAAAARKAQAEKFLSRPKYDPNDPAVIAREAKRREINEAREKREVERQKAKEVARAAELVRLAADEEAHQEALRLKAIAAELAHEEKMKKEAELEYERKLDRDARYAARKARKKQGKSEAQRYR